MKDFDIQRLSVCLESKWFCDVLYFCPKSSSEMFVKLKRIIFRVLHLLSGEPSNTALLNVNV